MNSALQLFDEIDFVGLWVEQVLTTYFVGYQVYLPKNSLLSRCLCVRILGAMKGFVRF